MRQIRTTLIIPVSVPPAVLRANGSRGSAWSARDARRKQRAEACLAAKIALNGRTPPLWKHATYKIVAHTMAQWDDDNVISALKGARDGIKDALIISDDKNLKITGVEFSRARGRPRIELHVTGEGLV